MILNLEEQIIDEKPESSQSKNTSKHIGHLKHALIVQNEVANTAAAGNHLGHDRYNERDTETNTHSGQDVGQASGQYNSP